MSKIKVMSELLANKIAAGEVIEKCASVVKELVENAIDADAKIIKINLLKGGLDEINVIDDGIGMDREDAKIAFQRHATSKLLKEDDLFFVDTLGFRGEALASIASVSEVLLSTCNSDIGTKVHLKGGKILAIEDADARKGSNFTITNLFYNTPARLKYLKNESSELASITLLIEKMSLSHPEIAFTLTNNIHEVIKTSGSNNLLKVIHEIYGLNVSSNMLEINIFNDDYHLYGYICKPSILKSSRNDMTTFVNKRLVKNNNLNKIINDAYYTYKPVDRYPIVILNIETDPTLIDVNIHPTKQDIKISKIDDLDNLLYEGIKDALYNSLLIPKAIDDINEEETINQEIINNDFMQKAMDFNDEVIVNNQEIKSLSLYPIGLALGTYIIAENDEGLFILDQHAVQERINYEKYMKALKEEKHYLKQMLIPITIEMTKSDYIKFLDKASLFQKLGFKYEEFGINTLIIKKHPDYLLEGYEEESIRKIIDLIINLDKEFDSIKFQEKIAITLACKMSIKANMHTSMDKIEYLIKELVKCDNPYNCPHGRPTIIKFSLYDLEKLFKRVM